MKLSIATLFCSAFAMVFQEPIKGALIFHTEDCGSWGNEKGERIDIDTSVEQVQPKNLTEIKSAKWVYPSDSFRVEFYKDKEAKEPYATVTGEKNGFTGLICSKFVGEFQLEVSATQEAKDSERLFLKPESYYKIVRVEKEKPEEK